MDNQHNIAKHCVISGTVQGVFFRKSTYHKAIELGLKGWVRNLNNGNVECYVYGPIPRVESFCKWLHVGPSAAKVEEVIITDAPSEEGEGFEII